MNLRIISLVLLIPLCCFSQQFEKKKLYGKIIEQNLNPNFFSLNFPFIGINAISSNNNLFADAGIDFKIDRIFGEIKYRYNYLDDFSGAQFNYKSVYEEEDSRSLNFGLGFIIKTKTVEESTSFHLKTIGKTEFYANAVVPKTKYIAINIGHQSGFTLYTGVGKRFVYKNLDGSDVIPYYQDKSFNTTTYMTFSTLSLGFRSGYLGYWKAKIENYGERESQQMDFYFVNLLLLYKSDLDDVVLWQLEDNNYYFQRVSLKDTKFSRLGICGGYQIQDINKIGFGFRIEVGYYPGVKGNLLNNFGLMLATNFRLSKLYK